MAASNPIAEFAQRCIEQLEAGRAAGESSYPMPLDQLLAAATVPGIGSTSVLRARVVKHATFRQRCLVAHARHPDAPVALVEDLRTLAASPQLFEFACRHTPGGPPWLSTDLKKAVVKPLQTAFDQALRSQSLRSHSPSSTMPTLMPPSMPTPLGPGAAPPLASAAVVAFSADERLFLMILDALRQHAATSPPTLYPTLRQLAESVSLSPLKLASRLKKLASSARFLEHAVPLLDKHLDSPIARRADADGMARRPSSVELLVRTARTDKKRLIARKDLLKKAAAAIRPALQLFLDEQLAAGGTLDAVAAIRDGKDWKFFLLEDLEPTSLRWRLAARPSATSTATPTTGEQSVPPVDGGDTLADLTTFAPQLATAFERLDRESGGHNQVSLRHLRAALPNWDRAAFDLRLSRLRQAGDYTLSGMQNRGGVSAEDQEAGIREGGVLRIYLSRLRNRDMPSSDRNS